MTDFLDTGPAGARCRLLLAHGAGAPMTSPFMDTMAALLGEHAIAVSRFEFPYMAARRHDGKRRPPARAESLIGDYEAAIAAASSRSRAKSQTLFIGGKSMGGRVASLIADRAYAEKTVAGLVCLGYPFHPPGKPDNLRTGHLETLTSPALIVQGERDPFGTRAEVEGYDLSQSITYAWMPDGDHDLGPRGNSGFTRKGNLTAAAAAIAAFISEHTQEIGL